MFRQRGVGAGTTCQSCCFIWLVVRNFCTYPCALAQLVHT